MKRLLVGIPLSLTFLGLHHQAFGQPATSEHGEYFEKHIRPIFVERCQGCHDSKAHTAGLDLTTASGLQKGADSGPVVVPGDLEKSRLIQVVSYLERTKMPPTGKLSDPELTALREWVKLGRAMARRRLPRRRSRQRRRRKAITRAQNEFWSFRPLQRITPPPVRRRIMGSLARSTDSSSRGSESAQLSPARPPTSGCSFAVPLSI